MPPTDHAATPPADRATDRPAAHARVAVLFVGAPRSGSTLVGQLLNHHPACLIANEHAVLPRWCAGEASFDALLQSAAHEAWRLRSSGLESDERFAPELGRYQRKWRSFAPLRAVVRHAPPTPITVVGDKKAGGNTKAFGAHPERVSALIRRDERIRLVQVERDPLCAAKSLMRSHGHADLPSALREIVGLQSAGARLRAIAGGRACALDYDALRAHPHRGLSGLAASLGLDPIRAWLDACAQVIDRAPPERHTAAERDELRRVLAAAA
jgi:hypothetical protein